MKAWGRRSSHKFGRTAGVRRRAVGRWAHAAACRAGQCITLGGTIKGVTRAVHASKWQRRANADSPWTDVPDSAKEGSICS